MLIKLVNLFHHSEIEWDSGKKSLDLITAFSNNKTLIKLLIRKSIKRNNLEKSGIYRMNCNKCYVGQTKRNIGIRFKEHKSHTKNLNLTFLSN